MKKTNKIIPENKTIEVDVPVADEIVSRVVEPSNQSKFRKIITVLLILAGVFAIFFYFQASRLAKDPNKVSEARVTEIVGKVGKIIDLPKDEVPTVAEVSDANALKDQPFFINAKVGDLVLLYTASQKAFLYDPEANIILEVASLNLGNK